MKRTLNSSAHFLILLLDSPRHWHSERGMRWCYRRASRRIVRLKVSRSRSLQPARACRSAVSQQFSATVTASSDTSVTWSASGGTISNSGQYTAPSTAGTYTVVATSVADSTKSASAAITVTTTPAPVAVTITPGSAAVQVGKTQQFSASVTGSSNTAVTWSASGGTISASGLYTAPSNRWLVYGNGDQRGRHNGIFFGDSCGNYYSASDCGIDQLQLQRRFKPARRSSSRRR